MNSMTDHFHPDIEQNTMYEERLKNKNIRSMPVGNERLAALRDLGATFDEGQNKTIKIATPNGTPKLPTFVDASQVEKLLQQKNAYTNPFIPSFNAGRSGIGRYGGDRL